MSQPFKKKILKIVLTLSRGQVEVECGFSLNKEVTVENLLEWNLVARRLLCQKVSGIVVSKEMLMSCKAMELKKEPEMSEERLKRKRKHEEI